MSSLTPRLRRGAVALVAAVAATATAVGVAVADDISNKLDSSVDATAEAMPLNVGGANGTTQLYVNPSNGDGKNGCNLTGGSSLTLILTSSNTAIATVSPSSVTFTSCSDLKPVTVTPVAEGSATISATTSTAPNANTTGASFDTRPATFTATVGPRLNTAPTIAVAGVTAGASYAKGSVPAATCNVTDAEDGSSSFAATRSAITGPNAADGLGSQTASCSYTDGGGLRAESSKTYAIVDPSAPVIGRTLTPASPDGDNGWYRSDVALAWSVSEPQSPTSLAKTGCVDQSVTADQHSTTYTCEATSAGGPASQQSVAIKRDATEPAFRCADAPNAWISTAVSLDCTASDVTSGLARSADAAFTLTADVAAGAEDASASTTSRTVADAAGNTVTAVVRGLKLDRKLPVVSCDAAPTTWQADNVALDCTASDLGAGLARDADATFTLRTTVPAGTETDSATIPARTIADAAGNEVIVGPFTGLKVDRRAPDADCQAAPATWSASDVTLECTPADGGSGVDATASGLTDGKLSVSTDVADDTETDSAETDAKTVKDGVGNEATARVTGIKVDRKAPATRCQAAPEGWSRTDVTRTCEPADGGSGVDATASDLTDGKLSVSTAVADGTETSAAATDTKVVEDEVGNTADAQVTGIKVDRKRPVLSCTAPGNDAWVAANVAVPCTGADGGSGIPAADEAFELRTSVPAGGTDASASTSSRTVTDGAGNSADAGPYGGFKVDRQAPVLTCASGNPATVVFGAAGSLNASAADGGSGVAAQPAPQAVDTASLGSKSRTFAADDRVGNQGQVACDYQVRAYPFQGFAQPIDGGNVLNVAKAGSAIPVKFSLQGYRGMAIIAEGFPKSTTIACSTTAASDTIETLAGTTSGLKYDAGTDQYNYTWKTATTLAGKCQRLDVRFVDGQTYSALFRFTK